MEGAVGSLSAEKAIIENGGGAQATTSPVAAGTQGVGAAAQSTTKQSASDEYGIVRLAYREGLLLSQAFKTLSGNVSVKADLKKAYVVRASDGSTVQVDLEKLFYAYDVKDDCALYTNDRVVIPYASQGVYVTGEVIRSAWGEVTGQNRLSEALKNNVTAWSQTRSVKVKSRDGTEKVYDLFMADRKGDLTQDPILRPGDVVTVGKAERLVKVMGEVRRPGTYGLLTGEGLKELIGIYGDGALASAQTDRVVMTRKASEAKPGSESLVVDLGGSVLPDLYDGDEVRLPSREEYLPVVYVEGAVGSLSAEKAIIENGGGAQATTSPVAAGTQGVGAAAQSTTKQSASDEYGIVRLAYREGLLLSQAFKTLSGNVSVKADLKKAYVVRASDGSTVQVDLEKLFYAYDVKDDCALYTNDRVVIPYASQGVYVTGEVIRSAWGEVTGQNRLSEALKNNVTAWSQTRSVKVKSRDGTEKVYDLFMADRKGDLTQDPILRPGDVVTVGKAERLVKVMGR